MSQHFGASLHHCRPPQAEGSVLGMISHADAQPGGDAMEDTGAAFDAYLSGNKRLAKWAQISDGGVVDIQEDVVMLAYLHIGRLDALNTHAMTKGCSGRMCAATRRQP